MSLVQIERHALCDALLAAGSDAPTLCEGWSVLDLAAHLVVRERRPDAAPGLVVPALAPRLEHLMAKAAAAGLAELVDQLRTGPPLWSPFRLPGVDRLANLAEFVVHHEDVRRANGAGSRTDVDDLSEEVWGSLARSVVHLARIRLPVVAVHTDGRRQVLRSGDNPVVLTGAPIDLLLRFFGRKDVAEVDVSGPSLSVTRFEAARLQV